MSVLTVVVAAFVLALIATTIAFGVGILAIPIALIVLGAIALVEFNKKRKQATLIHNQRERARSDAVEFTERDEQTLAHK
jgi:predicted membrane protein